ncbi:MAG: hypothetical protein K9K66_17755 [Desulfarculaceae bacterium]|nr:hypothetical protein [Desulfarculaceae bacterium]MCF8073383.1 hypothetical protein [Desulfarculaceae bacterium]MCF8103507.1 hypothetical protein [Desulfarculaceae bacterium]MCF8115794.1 hypothetical protein [Desulfarculaceae bacterium]
MRKMVGMAGLVLLAAMTAWFGPGAAAGELAYVAGSYQGTARLGQVKDNKPQPGEATRIKAELKQEAQRLKGMLTVGGDPKDQIVLEINSGKVQGNRLWFKGDELLWKVSFKGEFKDGRIVGQVLFTSQDPTKKLYGQSKVKDYQPTQLGGPLEMQRR